MYIELFGLAAVLFVAGVALMLYLWSQMASTTMTARDSSKQVLQQFIQSGGFLVLEIVCSHVPPWIEVEAERRGYTLETEQIEKDSVKVRLTTNAGR